MATPPGVGGVAIIRVSGPAVQAIAQTMLTCPTLSPYRLRHGQVCHPLTHIPIDEALAVLMPGPRSYTGEDVLEIHCHGGWANTGRVLQAVLAAGARPAEPGEFTRRAFEAGRIDLAQAEAVADIVAAQSAQALQLAQEQRQGRLSRAVEAIREALISSLALAEALVDFPEEEDITELSLGEVERTLLEAESGVRALLQGASWGCRVREGALVVLAGRPNAGKSTLFNALLGRPRALVHPTPGTTRDLLEEPLEMAGLSVRLVDTAGLRRAEGVEAAGVALAYEALTQAHLVVGVLDATHLDDAPLRELPGPEPLVVVNKVDLAPHAEWPGALRVSALRGQGLEELRRAIVSRCLGPEGSLPQSPEGAVVTHARHLHSLTRSLEAIQSAKGAMRLGPEFVADDLRHATRALGEITGETADPDLLERIFSRFCIGK